MFLGPRLGLELAKIALLGSGVVFAGEAVGIDVLAMAADLLPSWSELFGWL